VIVFVIFENLTVIFFCISAGTCEVLDFIQKAKKNSKLFLIMKFIFLGIEHLNLPIIITFIYQI